MKTRFLIIFAGIISLVSILIVIDDASALCIPDSDWPGAPCYGCPSCYPGIEQEKIDWLGYFDYKGEQWMNQKKSKMLKVIEQEGLEQWLHHKSPHYTDSNRNVWTYYYLKGEVPREHGKYLGEFDPPRFQFSEQYPQSYVGVLCNDGMELLVKENKKTPACVTGKSAGVLVERGWGHPVRTKTVDDDIWHGSVRYDIDGGILSRITSEYVIRNNIVHTETISLTFEIIPQTNGTLAVSIPHGVMNTDPDKLGTFEVTVDGNKIDTVWHNKRDLLQMHIIPFDSDTEEITISIPPWPLWIKVEKMQFDYDDWIVPPIEMTEENIKNFPNLQRAIRFVDEPENIMYRTVSSEESVKLKELFGVAYNGQRYMTYGDNLYTISWSFQYDRPE